MVEPTPIDTLFNALSVAYGRRFAAQWSGQRESEVKAHWQAQLHGIAAYRIAWALRNLPPKFPPTAMEFAELCRHAPSRKKAVEAPKAQEATEVLPADKKRLEGAIGAVRGGRTANPLAWAELLKAREAAGESLTPAQKTAWRDALGRRPLPQQSEDE